MKRGLFVPLLFGGELYDTLDGLVVALEEDNKFLQANSKFL